MPALWSGVYYVQATAGDAPIVFYDKNKIGGWPDCVIEKTEENEINSSEVSIKPETGMLLLFPSYFEHSVLQQRLDQERISISFNFSTSLKKKEF